MGVLKGVGKRWAFKQTAYCTDVVVTGRFTQQEVGEVVVVVEEEEEEEGYY